MRNRLLPFIFKTLGLLPLAWARALGGFAGTLMWLSKGRDYRMTIKNLFLCMPQLNQEERHKFALASLRETAKTAAEAGAIWRNSWDWLSKHIVEQEGAHLYAEELAKGKGLIVLGPHLGNWEVVAPYVASMGELTAMYQPAPIPALDAMILKGRSKLNITMAPTNRKGISQVIKALQKGGMVGILPDQVPEKDSGGEPVLFFGHHAMTMTFIHSLITRTGCRAVIVFAKRVPGGFKLITLPAAPEIYSEDQAESLRGLNKSVEACVALAPEQYQWEYNRFRWLPAHLKPNLSALKS